MRYAFIIYFDPKKLFDGSPEAQAAHAAAGLYAKELKDAGHWVGDQPLALPDQSITVSVRENKTLTTDGPFIESKEMIAGFVQIEAKDLNEAVRLAAGMPYAKLGHIEVRPAPDYSKPRPKL
jgi:hypothetical protein